MDDASDKETAEVLQGLIRHIEQHSDAATAYDVARDYQVSMGIGGFRMRADYTDPMSFDQDILIDTIPNPFCMYIDPRAMKPDRSDMRFGFLASWVPKSDFLRDYPNAEADGWLEFASIGDHAQFWTTGDAVRVVEYYCIKHEQVEIALLASGEVMPLAEVPADIRNLPEEQRGELILRTREANVPRVKWYKLTATGVLDQKNLPGDEVPLFPLIGEEHIVDGCRVIRGAIRSAKDAQRQYNFMATAETEAIALAPKAPFKIAEGQIEGYEEMWKNANNVNYAALIYKPVIVSGILVPEPQRETAEPAIQAISHSRLMAAEDMKRNFGMYDASLGARSNETSGRAILARQREGDNAHYHLTDNFNRVLRRLGKLMLKWIPVYYSQPGRVERIIGEEGNEKTVKLNTPLDELDANGRPKIFDVTTGKYDVVIQSGPSAATKRQEAVASMLEMTKAMPESMQYALDVLVQNMDWPGAKALADRLKKMLPPQLQEEDGKTPIPPKAMAMIQQQGAMIEQLTAVANQQAEEINTKRLELESKERIAAQQTQAQLVITQAQIESKEEIELLKQGVATTNAKLDAATASMDRMVTMLSVRQKILNADEPVGEEQPVSAGV